MNATIRQLLDTADLLIEGNGDPTTGPVTGGPATVGAAASVPAPPTALTATAASRCRGAAFALRAALESAVVARLTDHGAPRTIREGSMRAALLWLRGCAEVETARRAKAAWSQLCLGCHYHQYEIGPTQDQVHAWCTEVAAVVGLLAR
ncbi:hypothetical protein OG264_28780 [Streptomyces xanthophaeus]|uniref:hypothetical protein n=1 Tax=Streptomyces xanthophaeus TaxID=67385 RepID=UPI00386AE3EC|nr:hypothetical protein OG264_28780 [Streptomyces xanthophaeus]WST59878.1 hypothetical protein OG605_09660 [Streptomyces xanthophaeus]